MPVSGPDNLLSRPILIRVPSVRAEKEEACYRVLHHDKGRLKVLGHVKYQLILTRRKVLAIWTSPRLWILWGCGVPGPSSGTEGGQVARGNDDSAYTGRKQYISRLAHATPTRKTQQVADTHRKHPSGMPARFFLQYLLNGSFLGQGKWIEHSPFIQGAQGNMPAVPEVRDGTRKIRPFEILVQGNAEAFSRPHHHVHAAGKSPYSWME